MQNEDPLMYEVTKIRAPLVMDADWNKAPWASMESLSLDHHMGEKPTHFPKVEAKVAYDNSAIYVIFRVRDQYIRAVRSEHQEGVYNDSCVPLQSWQYPAAIYARCLL
nr:hypothetical protein [Saprospiraceae bacterium]